MVWKKVGNTRVKLTVDGSTKSDETLSQDTQYDVSVSASANANNGSETLSDYDSGSWSPPYDRLPCSYAEIKITEKNDIYSDGADMEIHTPNQTNVTGNSGDTWQIDVSNAQVGKLSWSTSGSYDSNPYCTFEWRAEIDESFFEGYNTSSSVSSSSL